MGRLGVPGWLRSEPRLRIAGVGRLGLPGWLSPSPAWLQALPVTKSGEVERTLRAGFYQPIQTKSVTRSISQGWGQGQSALGRDTPRPLAHLVQGVDPRAEPGPGEQVWPGRRGRTGKGGHFGISRADT